MQRLTVTFDDDLMGEIDRFMESRGYSNRSEALRDLARAGLVQAGEGVDETRDCLALLVYVYEPDTRELPKRLAAAQLERRDLVVTTLQRPLDADRFVQVALLEGATTEVRAFSERITAERGVKNGRLVVVPKTGAD
ncbi:nickel-responsive transcriptional regulator NikR [Siculibacillus lacustris]|uniref:Putative nickel-responsive regulator n=1 Tax=Siculibacillus lacustris TaxID=1549641 RepID=A0A4Q9VQP0_9HYPH|nr:nickel-responsive transcriptional regulator NikR [Siculibacillus lacustris]TBW37633.1 nickel-responsive transcriptional regulator NikR [Siculibacillus lacustris]